VKGYSISTPAVEGLDFAVNGPQDERLEWDAIDWRVHESTVVRLRRRIFKATREHRLPNPQRPSGLLEPRCGESPLARCAP
jgi:hypothetical protein